MSRIYTSIFAPAVRLPEDRLQARTPSPLAIATAGAAAEVAVYVTLETFVTEKNLGEAVAAKIDTTLNTA